MSVEKKFDSRRIWQIILIYASAFAAAMICNQSFADHAPIENKMAPALFKASPCEVSGISHNCHARLLQRPKTTPKTTSF